MAVGREPTQVLGHSPEDLCVQRAALADQDLARSTQTLSLLLQDTSTQAFRVVFVECFVRNFTRTFPESAVATAGGCWGFPFQT